MDLMKGRSFVQTNDLGLSGFGLSIKKRAVQPLMHGPEIMFAINALSDGLNYFITTFLPLTM